MIYRLYTAGFNQNVVNAAMTVNQTLSKSFLFDPTNTDYQQFRKDIANGAELQDASGTVMTASQIQAFMSTLP